MSSTFALRQEQKAIELHESARRISKRTSEDALLTFGLQLFVEDSNHAGVATGSDVVALQMNVPMFASTRTVCNPAQTFKHKQSFKSHGPKDMRCELVVALTTLSDRIEHSFAAVGAPTIEQIDKRRAVLTFRVLDNYPTQLPDVSPSTAERFWLVEVEVESMQTPTVLRVTLTNDPAQHPDLWKHLTRDLVDLHYNRSLSLLVGLKKKSFNTDDDDNESLDGARARATASTTVPVIGSNVTGSSMAGDNADEDDNTKLGGAKRARVGGD